MSIYSVYITPSMDPSIHRFGICRYDKYCKRKGVCENFHESDLRCRFGMRCKNRYELNPQNSCKFNHSYYNNTITISFHPKKCDFEDVSELMKNLQNEKNNLQEQLDKLLVENTALKTENQTIKTENQTLQIKNRAPKIENNGSFHEKISLNTIEEFKGRLTETLIDEMRYKWQLLLFSIPCEDIRKIIFMLFYQLCLPKARYTFPEDISEYNRELLMNALMDSCWEPELVSVHFYPGCGQCDTYEIETKIMAALDPKKEGLWTIEELSKDNSLLIVLTFSIYTYDVGIPDESGIPNMYAAIVVSLGTYYNEPDEWGEYLVNKFRTTNGLFTENRIISVEYRNSILNVKYKQLEPLLKKKIYVNEIEKAAIRYVYWEHLDD